MDDIKDYFENKVGPEVCNCIFDIKRQIEFQENSYKETKFSLDFNIEYHKKTPTFFDIIENKELTYDDYIYKTIAMKYNYHVQRKLLSYTISDKGIVIIPYATNKRIKILSRAYN